MELDVLLKPSVNNATLLPGIQRIMWKQANLIDENLEIQVTGLINCLPSLCVSYNKQRWILQEQSWILLFVWREAHNLVADRQTVKQTERGGRIDGVIRLKKLSAESIFFEWSVIHSHSTLRPQFFMVRWSDGAKTLLCLISINGLFCAVWIHLRKKHSLSGFAEWLNF